MDEARNAAGRAPFPQNPEEFDGDDRISFSKVSNRFVLETEDGQEFEYHHDLKRWIEVVR
jgi:HIV Tat-specific factor 1